MPEFDDKYRSRRFRDPGGRSALHPVSRRNPRKFPCPTCGTPNVLTEKDVRAGYQCDRCADRVEGTFYDLEETDDTEGEG